MKLRNKKTGEIVDYISFERGGGQISMYVFDTNKHYYYSSLAELNEEWEDYKDPESIKSVEVRYRRDENKVIIEYDSKEVRTAYEKACAWKRLKNKGFRFGGWKNDAQTISYNFGGVAWPTKELKPDLDLLFGGEE